MKFFSKEGKHIRKQPCTLFVRAEQNWGSYLAITVKGGLDMRETTNILPMTLMATLLLSIAYPLRADNQCKLVILGQNVVSNKRCKPS